VTITLTRLVDALSRSRKEYGKSVNSLLRSLKKIAIAKIDDAETLLHIHEVLLFLRAYPANAKVIEEVDRALKTFNQRVSKLRTAGIDLSPLDDPEVSGIVGTSVTSNFSYEIVRWLVNKYPNQLSIDWEWLANEDTFGATMPQFLPLLAEDALVEAHVPFREWLKRAAGRANEVVWLIQRFEKLTAFPRAKARMYDSMKIHVRWEFGFAASRTGLKLPVRSVFFHREPLIQRRDISLKKELASTPIPIEKLSVRSGEKILDLARATSAVRYRELHGFTYGDPKSVQRADLGRGTEAYVMAVPPEHRLPLRAYHAAMIFKNGVPVGYFEGLSLFERMESGFNLYYTFREGETAWLFARILRLMKQLLGVTAISIDPYQIGHENEEGIESGAFWFYRKLGFRPVRKDSFKLTLSEEKRIKARPSYRTSPRTLRRLAQGYMLLDGSNSGRSEWDNFQVRNIGLAVQESMSRNFKSDPDLFRNAALRYIETSLRGHFPVVEPELVRDFACALMLIPDLGRWTNEEKRLLAEIIRAKARRSESTYLKLMQRHARLRASIVQLGSRTISAPLRGRH
jgi:hypothetical protein